MQCREFRAQGAQPFRSQAIGMAPFFHRQRLNELLLFEPRDCSIERAWAQSRSAHTRDVLDHRMPMLRSISEAGKNQQGGIRIVAAF